VQARHADCIDVVRFYPSPRQIVDVYVQMRDKPMIEVNDG
jgi:hypothetical protein